MAAEELNIGLTVTADQSGGRKLLKIPKDITASNLRKLVSEATNIPLAGLRVIFRGKIIAESDKMAVEEFKLSEDCVLHCMGKPVAGASASSTEAATPPIAAAAAGSSVTIPAASAAAVPTASAPANTLQAAFAKLKSSNSAQVYMTGVTTLDKILSNIINHPMEEKYRKVKKHNAAFQKRLGGLVGGDDAMMAAGFTTETESDSGEEIYMMQASAEKWPALVAAKATTEQAARQAKAAMGAPAPHPPLQPMTGGMPNFGGFPGFGGGAAGMPDMGSPQMQQAAAAMMQDPQAIQAMLQNPMVQNMMRNDPRFANNPMMQQSLEQMANNPQMLQQISQMMQDPNAQRQMQQMQQMMGSGAGAGGMPPFGGGMPPFGGGAAAGGSGGAGAPPAQGDANDSDQTEEEMIAEAIRRSLEENGSGSGGGGS